MMNFLGALVLCSCISRELTGRLPMFSFHSCFHVFPQVTPVKFWQILPPKFGLLTCAPLTLQLGMNEIQGAHHPNATQNPTTNRWPLFFSEGIMMWPSPSPNHLQCFFSGRNRIFFFDAEKEKSFGVGEKVEVQVKPEKISHLKKKLPQ